MCVNLKRSRRNPRSSVGDTLDTRTNWISSSLVRCPRLRLRLTLRPSQYEKSLNSIRMSFLEVALPSVQQLRDLHMNSTSFRVVGLSLWNTTLV